MPFTLTQLALPGMVLIEPRIHRDSRGYFMELFKESEFITAGIDVGFVQENQSRSTRGTLRGLHFQRPPMAQAKLIRVLEGEIYDVGVDIRPDSPTFGQWVGVTLSARDGQMAFIPSWCAHGFCVLSDYADVLYKTTAEYAPELEGGLAWDDPALGIAWPLSNPILSERDRRWPPLERLRDLPGRTGVGT